MTKKQLDVIGLILGGGVVLVVWAFVAWPMMWHVVEVVTTYWWP